MRRVADCETRLHAHAMPTPENDLARQQRFPDEVLARLFDAVETDDVVGPLKELPPTLELPCTAAELRTCMALCVQFWEEGTPRGELARMVGGLLRGRDWNAQERLALKHIRARFKHLQSAQRLYGMRHKVGFLIWSIAGVMGEVQDALRNDARRTAFLDALVLRVLITRPLWELMQRQIRRLQLDDAAGLASHRKLQIQSLRERLRAPVFTGHQFHMMRVIIGQQVSYYDTRRSIQPANDLYAVSRFLASINGLMGARHDEMVADAIARRRPYATRDPLDSDIRNRLETLVSTYGG